MKPTRLVLAALLATIPLAYSPAAEASVVINLEGSPLLNHTGPITTDPAQWCGDLNVTLPPDGDPIQVNIPPGPTFTMGSINPTWWKTPPTPDPVWQLVFRSLIWMQPIVQAAATADPPHSQTISAAIAQVTKFYAENPDTGTSAGGWDEGTSMRRLTTLNCLYTKTHNTRLLTPMESEVAVQSCPRYYGPPCNAVHNHGLMGNMTMWRAGSLIAAEPPTKVSPAWHNAAVAWMTTAVSRMKLEAPQVFNANGLTREQSSGYHLVNINLWTSAAEIVRLSDPTAAATIDTALARARNALKWMAWPDGRFVLIGGGSNQIEGQGPSTGRSLVDDQYGYAFGRFSWTNPLTSYYAIRYGPGRAYHGTQDRPGVQWGTLGERVLIEPGTYSYDPTSDYTVYQGWTSSQNRATPNGITESNVGVTKSGQVLYTTNHSFVFTSTQFPTRPYQRWIAVYDPEHRIRIVDTYTPDPTRTDNGVKQYLHLDPTWDFPMISTDKKSVTFTAASGRLLRITTTGTIATTERGLTRPPRGWTFPAWGQRVPAYQITINGSPSVIDTILTVS